MTKSQATSRRPNPSKLGLRELQALFAEVLGEATRCPNRVFLERKIRARWAEDDATAAAAATEPATNDRGSEGEARTSAAPAVETHESPVAPPMPLAVEQPKRTRAARPGSPRGRFSSMTIEELHGTYAQVVGRPTGSSHRGYLVWKIREAENGRIPVGPRRAYQRDGEPVEMKTLPFRLESAEVVRMDEAWRARGIKSRMEFFRHAVGHYLEHIGTSDAAAMMVSRVD